MDICLITIFANIWSLLIIYVIDNFESRYKKLVICLLVLILVIVVMLPVIFPESFSWILYIVYREKIKGGGCYCEQY